MTSRRVVKVVVGGAVVAALGLGGAAMAGNGTLGADDADEKLRGPQAERAGEAAVKATGGGRATAVERDTDGSARYEVEVTRGNGTTVDVDVDGSFKVIATDDDGERAGTDRDDDANERDDANDADDRDEPDDDRDEPNDDRDEPNDDRDED